MTKTFEVGDLVWAKMKGYPAWPGKVVEPPENKKVDKKTKHYVYFFGSQNHAVVPQDMLWLYEECKDKYMAQSRPSHSFQESIDEIESYIKGIKTGVVKEKSVTPTSANLDSSPIIEDKPKSERKRTSSEISSPPLPIKTRILERDFMAALSSADSKPADEKKPSLDDSKLNTSLRDEENLNTSEDKMVSTPDSMVGGSAITPMQNEEVKSGGACIEASVLPTGKPKVAADEKSLSTPPNLETSPQDDDGSFLFPSQFKNVGLVGAGDMQGFVLKGLTSMGCNVHIWNKNLAKSKDREKKLVTRGSSASDIVGTCAITFICAEDAAEIKNLAFNKSGLLHGITSNKGLVNFSTIDIETTQVLNEAIMVRDGRYLEVPIVGSMQATGNNQIVLLASGDKSLFDECNTLFKALTKHVFYLGEVGLACKMKLVLEGLVGTTLAGLAESLALASKVGLDPTEVLDVLGSSSVASSFIKEMGSDMIKSRVMNPVHCRLSQMQQHLRMVINMSEGVDQPLHVASAVSELFKKAKAKGYADSDMVAIFRATDL